MSILYEVPHNCIFCTKYILHSPKHFWIMKLLYISVQNADEHRMHFGLALFSNVRQWLNVTKYLYSSTVLKYKFEVLVLYSSLLISGHFLLRHFHKSFLTLVYKIRCFIINSTTQQYTYLQVQLKTLHSQTLS